MSDGEHNDPLRRWLADDLSVLNTVFLVAASSLAIVLTACLWHHIHPEPPFVEQQHPDSAGSIFSAVLFSATRTPPSTSQQQSLTLPPSTLAAEEKDRKSTRSKERRRRGKDPFRDLLKSGKKSKVIKAIKATDDDNPPPSADAGNDIASSTSRSQSPTPVGDLLDVDRRAPRLDGDSDDGSAESMAPSGNTSTSTVTSSGDISDHSSSDACSRAIHPHPVTPDSMTVSDTQVNVSSASTVMEHASEEAPSSPPVPAACVDVRTPQPRNSQAASTSESFAKLVRARTRLRISRIDPGVKSSLSSSTPSTLPDSVANPFSSHHSNAPSPLLSTLSPTHSFECAGISTPTNIRPRPQSPSEDPCQGGPNTQPLDRTATSAQMQLTSMRAALETARSREERLRVEAEQASNERDELHWRWNEDVGLWKRREAELQAQIHHLMQQLQAFAAAASFQVQQTTNPSFASPTSPHAHASPPLQYYPLVSFPLPPVIQTQNSASAPAHVQALLASAPMLPSHPPVASASGGLYSGTERGMSPLFWSGLGLCVPKRDPRNGGRRTPDSSASASSSRGRRRRREAENVKSASDESSLDDGSGDEDFWEEEEDVFRNNALADAILKRPESIRSLSNRRPSGRPGMGVVWRGGAEEGMDALKDPALEKHDVVPPLVDTSAARTVADAPDRQ